MGSYQLWSSWRRHKLWRGKNLMHTNMLERLKKPSVELFYFAARFYFSFALGFWFGLADCIYLDKFWKLWEGQGRRSAKLPCTCHKMTREEGHTSLMEYHTHTHTHYPHTSCCVIAIMFKWMRVRCGCFFLLKDHKNMKYKQKLSMLDDFISHIFKRTTLMFNNP